MLRVIKESIIQLLARFEWGKEKIWQFGRDYIAGSSLDEGIDKVSGYYLQGRHSTLDLLGEAATTEQQADRYQQNYIGAIDMLEAISNHDNPSTVSVKASSICCVGKDQDNLPSEEQLTRRLEEILEHAVKKGINITLDMENHRWTDLSVDVSRRLWDKGYTNLQLGIVQQACLDRTEGDINDIATNYSQEQRKGIRVRICKGIYIEPRSISTRSKRKIQKRLIERIKQLFDSGFYVEIATHDHSVINQTLKYIDDNNIPSTRFEFQFLKGVQKGYDIEKEIIGRGFIVRYYMPVELEKYDGVPYMVRRCIENPRIAIAFLKNLYHKHLKKAA